MLITVMFLSAVWIPFLTAPIHCRRSISEEATLWTLIEKSDIIANAKFLQICSHEKKLKYLHIGQPEGE